MDRICCKYGISGRGYKKLSKEQFVKMCEGSLITILRQQYFTNAQTFWLFKVYAEVVKSWLPRFATTLDAS